MSVFHRTSPFAGATAATCPSLDPAKTVPSGPIAGVPDRIAGVSATTHLSAPDAVTA